MKKQAWCLAILLFLFLKHSALLAQEPEIQSPEAIIKQSKNQKTLSKIGFDTGVGTSEMRLKALNQRLGDLNIGWLDEVLTTLYFNFYTEIKNSVGVSMDFGIGISQDGKLYQRNTYLNFTTISFGPSVYVPLFRTKRIFLWATTGWRTINMRLKYNFAQNNAANFNSLFTNPTANSSAVNITSDFNENALFGGRFQFRLEKGYQERTADFRLGLDGGYAYCYKFYPWHETGSRVPLANMPVVKPDNLYFNVNFSGYF